jgi:hypothetical protein
MLKAICKHCQRPIEYEQGNNGVWYEPTPEVQLGAQYCYMDPIAGSQLHEPNMDTIKQEA